MTTIDSLITRERTRHGLTKSAEKRIRASAANWLALYPSGDLRSVFGYMADVAKGDQAEALADVRRMLTHEGNRIAELAAELETARQSLRGYTALAVFLGVPEAEVARLASVNRRTVRASVGKA